MIRRCAEDELSAILSVINDAAEAYRGVIPEDCFTEPYMSALHLRDEIASGVEFWGFERDGELTGVMGIQDVGEVSLIRHAYVRSTDRNCGIGSSLLAHLRNLATKPMLVGTWADADWAIHFYEKHGFRLVTAEEKDRLLGKYWSIPGRQIETSVVLTDPAWFRQTTTERSSTRSFRRDLVRPSSHGVEEPDHAHLTVRILAQSTRNAAKPSTPRGVSAA